MRIFLAADGDSIGKLIGQSRLRDNVEEVRRISQKIEKGNQIFVSYAISNGGSIIESGGDEVLIELNAIALNDLEDIRKQYYSTTNATVSVGIGKKPSEASKALLIAKVRGRNRSVFYDEDVEKEFNKLSTSEEDEHKKTVSEYFSKSLMKRANDSGGLAQPGQAQRDVIASNTMSVPASPQTQETVADAINNRAIQLPGQPIPIEAQQSIVPVAQTSNNSGSIRDFENQFRGHADQHEKHEKAKKFDKSKEYQKIKEKVAEALEDIQRQMQVLEQLKQQAPDAYQAIIEVVQGLILVGKQLTNSDEALEKIEKLNKLSIGHEYDFNDSLGSLGEPFDKTALVGGLADNKSPEEFDQEQLAIGTQRELEHTDNIKIAQKIAMDHLTEDPNYYKDLTKSEDEDRRATISRELQYDGSTQNNKHTFINKSDSTKWEFIETTEPESYGAEAANNVAEVIKKDYEIHPVFSYNLAGRHGIMFPYINDTQTLKETKPQLLTSEEKVDLMVEFLIDWLVGNSNEPGDNLIKTINSKIISLCKKDAFKDFNGIGQYYQIFIDSIKNGTIMFDLDLLNPYFDIIGSIDDNEYLDNIGKYAQCVFKDDTDAQLSFAKLILLRKRNAGFLFTSLFKQELNKAERPEYGKMRARIDAPVGAVIFGKIKVRHWDGKESWKSIRSGAILGLDPGPTGAGHAVSAKNPSAK